VTAIQTREPVASARRGRHAAATPAGSRTTTPISRADRHRLIAANIGMLILAAATSIAAAAFAATGRDPVPLLAVLFLAVLIGTPHVTSPKNRRGDR